MAKIISFFNHKGGVAKTTTVHNLACALKGKGQKVLVIDTDPQMNLTAKVYGLSTSAEYTQEIGELWRTFNENHTSIDEIVYSILKGEKPNTIIFKTENSRGNTGSLDLIPSSFKIALLETDIVDIIKRNNSFDVGRLYNIEKYIREELGKEYDFIFIDFSPSASSLINAMFMMMSDYFIVPAVPTLFCIQAIDNLSNVFINWSTVLEQHKRTSSTNGLSFMPKFIGITVSMVKRRAKKGINDTSTASKKWIELIHESVESFQKQTTSTGRAISEDKFKQLFKESDPFIVNSAYDVPLEVRTRAESLGVSEYDLQESDMPTQTSTRQDQNGNEVKINQALETLLELRKSYSYIADGLIELAKP